MRSASCSYGSSGSLTSRLLFGMTASPSGSSGPSGENMEISPNLYNSRDVEMFEEGSPASTPGGSDKAEWNVGVTERSSFGRLSLAIIVIGCLFPDPRRRHDVDCVQRGD